MHRGAAVSESLLGTLQGTGAQIPFIKNGEPEHHQMELGSYPGTWKCPAVSPKASPRGSEVGDGLPPLAAFCPSLPPRQLYLNFFVRCFNLEGTDACVFFPFGGPFSCAPPPIAHVNSLDLASRSEPVEQQPSNPQGGHRDQDCILLRVVKRPGEAQNCLCSTTAVSKGLMLRLVCTSTGTEQGQMPPNPRQSAGLGIPVISEDHR